MRKLKIREGYVKISLIQLDNINTYKVMVENMLDKLEVVDVEVTAVSNDIYIFCDNIIALYRLLAAISKGGDVMREAIFMKLRDGYASLVFEKKEDVEKAKHILSCISGFNIEYTSFEYAIYLFSESNSDIYRVLVLFSKNGLL